jgi:hypothetical protein
MLKPATLFFLLAPALHLAAQDQPAPAPYKNYRAAVGLLGNPRALGVQAEVRVLKNFGVRLAGIQSFDYHRANERGGGATGLLTYYFPLKNKRLEPGLGIGGVYSLYHWNTGYRQGNLTDLNIGGGAGLNLRFSNDFRVGINVLVANGFEAGNVDGTVRAVSRKLLVLPALTFDVLL